MTVAGDGGDATFKVSGDGSVMARNYEVEHLTLDVGGNALVEAFAWGTVDGSAGGTSTVDLWGNADVEASLLAGLELHLD